MTGLLVGKSNLQVRAESSAGARPIWIVAAKRLHDVEP